MGIERRNHKAGAGDADDEVNVSRAHAGALEALFRGFLAELDGVLHVLVVGLGEWPGLDGVINGKNGMAIVDLGVVHDGHHGFDAALRDLEDAAKVIFHVIAGDTVGRERSSGRGDGRMRRMAVGRASIRNVHRHRPGKYES